MRKTIEFFYSNSEENATLVVAEFMSSYYGENTQYTEFKEYEGELVATNKISPTKLECYLIEKTHFVPYSQNGRLIKA